MREFVTRLLSDPATVRKFVIAFVGALSVALAEGLVPESWGSWLTVVIAFLTSIGVYGVPNADDKETVAAARLKTISDRGSVTISDILLVLLVVLVLVLLLVAVGVL